MGSQSTRSAICRRSSVSNIPPALRTAHLAVVRRAPSPFGLNVLVQPKKVVRIVFRFELLKSPIIRSIGRNDLITSLIVSKVVYIPSGSHEWLHRVVRVLCPGNASVVGGRIDPFR